MLFVIGSSGGGKGFDEEKKRNNNNNYLVKEKKQKTIINYEGVREAAREGMSPSGGDSVNLRSYYC